jgi:hypothetical protein
MFHTHLSFFHSPPDAPFEMKVARSTFGWQRTFRLPTPHLWVKSCLLGSGATDMTSGTASLDLRLRPACAA